MLLGILMGWERLEHLCQTKSVSCYHSASDQSFIGVDHIMCWLFATSTLKFGEARGALRMHFAGSVPHTFLACSTARFSSTSACIMLVFPKYFHAHGVQEGEEDEPEQRSRADQLQELLLESFAAGMEGLMLKTLDAGAAYQPSKRSDSWVKLKRCCPHFSSIFAEDPAPPPLPQLTS